MKNIKQRIVEKIPLAVLHIWGQIQLFGKTLPKKGLCKHYKNIELFTYLGDSPMQYCRTDDQWFYFNFIAREWIKVEKEDGV